MKHLSSLNTLELEQFFDSFDLVLSDVDGVLWNVLSRIPGTQEAARSLQKIGKKFVIVSNNATKSIDDFHKTLTSADFNVSPDDIVTPLLTTVYHLKKLQIEGKIFVLGMPCLKQALQSAGFQVADNSADVISTFGDFVQKVIDDDQSVVAVISEVYFNVDYVNLQKALTLLKRPEVWFFKGATDLQLPVGRDQVVVGPGVFHKILEEYSGRKAIPVAKPSPQLNEYLVEKFNITDPKRVLFIGDSVPEDMGFAASCGFQKFLVLSGLTTKNSITNWTFPQEFKPNYYGDSLKDLHEAILRLSK